MKALITLTIFMLSFQAIAETFSCNYSELKSIKTISFDRVNHSLFKICHNESCDKNRYTVIYADEENLIFGNIDLKEEKESDGFQLIKIDKKTKLFIASKINLPKNNIKNKFIKGECVLN